MDGQSVHTTLLPRHNDRAGVSTGQRWAKEMQSSDLHGNIRKQLLASHWDYWPPRRVFLSLRDSSYGDSLLRVKPIVPVTEQRDEGRTRHI